MPKASKSKKTRATTSDRSDTPAPAAPPWDAEASDLDLLGRCAADAAERRRTLEDALLNLWAAEDITQVRRIESEGRCLWVMWRRSSLPPA